MSETNFSNHKLVLEIIKEPMQKYQFSINDVLCQNLCGNIATRTHSFLNATRYYQYLLICAH